MSIIAQFDEPLGMRIQIRLAMAPAEEQLLVVPDPRIEQDLLSCWAQGRVWLENALDQ